jgi:hypothetical protein
VVFIWGELIFRRFNKHHVQMFRQLEPVFFLLAIIQRNGYMPFMSDMLLGLNFLAEFQQSTLFHNGRRFLVLGRHLDASLELDTDAHQVSSSVLNLLSLLWSSPRRSYSRTRE